VVNALRAIMRCDSGSDNQVQGKYRIAVLVASAALSGCSGSEYAQLPTGAAAYKMVPPVDQAPPITSYPISAGDELSITVFDEPDLSLEKVPVDLSGRIQMPLVGSVKVADLTPAEASQAIEAALAVSSAIPGHRECHGASGAAGFGRRPGDQGGRLSRGARYHAAFCRIDGAKPHAHRQAG
jgi:protein involved in polysaccharide export with SLBB domain